MGSEELNRTVQGDNGTLSTNETGTIETDNYSYGGGFDYDGSAYPYTVDPAEYTIQELTLTRTGDVVAEITTNAGETFNLSLAGGSGSFDKWSIDSITFRDPNTTGERIAGGWAGE